MEANYLHTSYSETESSESESEDSYIHMEVDSSFRNNDNDNNNNSMVMMMSHSTIYKEFEFQSFSSSSDRDQTTTSPADELFYMGKLLPLHLPPRLETLHKILQIPKKPAKKDENEEDEEEEEESFGSTPLYSTPTANTPFQSCNISPSESCHVSGELNPTEYFADYLSELQQHKKSWMSTERVLTKPTKNSSSSIGSKLKWAYLKSLFTTSGCTAADQRQFQNVNHCANGISKKTDKNHHRAPFGQIKSNKMSSDGLSKKDNVNNLVEGHHHNHHRHKKGSGHRRSFSGVFRRISKNNTSTIASSVDLNRHVLKSSEVDNSIQAAIAHCKRSQKEELQPRHIAKERAFCSISASYI